MAQKLVNNHQKLKAMKKLIVIGSEASTTSLYRILMRHTLILKLTFKADFFKAGYIIYFQDKKTASNVLKKAYNELKRGNRKVNLKKNILVFESAKAFIQ